MKVINYIFPEEEKNVYNKFNDRLWDSLWLPEISIFISPSTKTEFKQGIIIIHFYHIFFLDVGNPTSVTFISTDTGQIAASYTSEKSVLFDIETAKPVLTLSNDFSKIFLLHWILGSHWLYDCFLLYVFARFNTFRNISIHNQNGGWLVMVFNLGSKGLEFNSLWGLRFWKSLITIIQ